MFVDCVRCSSPYLFFVRGKERLRALVRSSSVFVFGKTLTSAGLAVEFGAVMLKNGELVLVSSLAAWLIDRLTFGVRTENSAAERGCLLDFVVEWLVAAANYSMLVT